jgi:hypothetical protein
MHGILDFSIERVNRDEEYGRLLRRRFRGEKLTKAEQRRFHKEDKIRSREGLIVLAVLVITVSVFWTTVVLMWPKPMF